MENVPVLVAVAAVAVAIAAAAAGIPPSPIKEHSARHAADHFRWRGERELRNSWEVK